jgi:hypothetical protein
MQIVPMGMRVRRGSRDAVLSWYDRTNSGDVRRYGSYETWLIPTKASTMAVSIIPTEGLM